MNYNYLFTDTDFVLSQEEEEQIEIIKSQEGSYYVYDRIDLILHNDIILRLIKNGFLRFFEIGKSIYIFPNDYSDNQMISAEINAYFVKMKKDSNNNIEILDKNTHEKIFKSRKFISKWIYKQEQIDDTLFKDFLKLYTNRASFVISFPIFLKNLFISEIQETEMPFYFISQEYKETKCPYCNTIIRINKKEKEMIKCKNCHQLFLG